MGTFHAFCMVTTAPIDPPSRINAGSLPNPAFTARFTRLTFAAYGVALLPFFVFNWYFYFEIPLLSEVGLLDFAGNLVMLVLCWHGWRMAEA